MPIEFNPNVTAAQVQGEVQGLQKELDNSVKMLQKILENCGINIVPSNGGAKGAGKVDKGQPFSAPDMDDERIGDVRQASVDFESVIAKIQTEIDEKLLKRLGDDLKNNKSKLSKGYQNNIKLINDSVEKAKKAEKAAKARRALGIFGAILAVVAAVAVTVLTGGVAAGFAIAGAVLACGSTLLDITGGQKAICNWISDKLQASHPEWSKAKCDAVAQGIYGGIFLALSLVTMIGGFVSASSQIKNAVGMAKSVMQTIRNIQGAVQLGSQFVNTGLGTASLFLNKNAGEAAAKVIDSQAEILAIKKHIDENNEDIEKMLEQMDSTWNGIMAVFNKETDTSNQILNLSTPQMA